MENVVAALEIWLRSVRNKQQILELQKNMNKFHLLFFFAIFA